MFLSFPTDVTLYLLSFLSVHDIRNFLLISRRSHALVAGNQDTVYHQAALYHRLTGPGATIDDLRQSETLSGRSGPWLRHAHTWKEICRRFTILERNWEGRGRVLEGGYSAKSYNSKIISFRIDQDQDNIIILLPDLSLRVHARENNEFLWGLRPGFTHGSTLLFSDGYLIIMGNGGLLQIWRRTTDAATVHYQLPGSPQVFTIFRDTPWKPPRLQLEESLRAIYGPDAPPQTVSQDDCVPESAPVAPVRGHFAPWALIDRSTTGPIRLTKFRYPILAILSSSNLDTVLLVDVRVGKVTRRVRIGADTVLGAPSGYTLPYGTDRVPMDLDINGDFVVIALHTEVIIVPLKNGSQDAPDGSDDEQERRIMVFSDHDHPVTLRDSSMKLRRAPHRRHRGSDGNVSAGSVEGDGAYKYHVNGHGALERYELSPPSEPQPKDPEHSLPSMRRYVIQSCFVAARLSPDGRHLAAATVFGLLYIIPDFARVLESQGNITCSELAVHVDVSKSESIHELEWGEQQHRLVVRTTSEELYIVSLDPAHHFPALHPSGSSSHASEPSAPTTISATSRPSPTDAFPRLTVYRLADFCDPALSWDVNHGMSFRVLQMTKTALWMGYDPALLQRAVEKRRERELGGGQDDSEGGDSEAGGEEDSWRHVCDAVQSVCYIDFSVDVL